MIELKKCPFCGSNDVLAIYTSRETGVEYRYEGQDVDPDAHPYIHCNGCDCTWFASDDVDGDDVIEMWNRRA